MKTIKKTHPDWVLKHKKSGTEIKKINNKYYVYGVKSVHMIKQLSGQKKSH